MAAKKKTNPLLTQAQQAAQAKIQPELEALSTLRGQALGDYSTARSQANAAAQIIAAGATQAQGGLADFLKRAGVAQGHITGPSGSEAQMVAQNLGLTSQAAGAGLAKIISDAPQAAAYQTQAARRTYDGANQQINDRLQQLSSDYGTDAVDEYNKLFNADQASRLKAAGITQTARTAAAGRQNARTIAGVDASGALIPGGTAATKAAAAKAKSDAAAAKRNAGVLPGGVKPLAASEFGTFQNLYGTASSTAKEFAREVKSGQITAAQALAEITGGQASQTVPLPKIGTDGQPMYDKSGNPVYQKNHDGSIKTHQTSAIPGVSNQLAATAALEAALHGGGISSVTAKKLHGQGITAQRLGLKVLPDAVFKAQVAARQAAAAVSNIHFGN